MKTLTSITIDTELIAEVRARKLNLSGTVNDLLSHFLDMSEEDEQVYDKDKLDADIIQLQGKLSRLKKMKEANLKVLEDQKPKLKDVKADWD
jgi:hypothetical protein